MVLRERAVPGSAMVQEISAVQDSVKASLDNRVEARRTGRVIVNPASGERIVVRTSGAETGGRLLVFDLFLPPAAQVPARHAHPEQQEYFTVMAGRMRFVVGRQTRLVSMGDTVEVQPGRPHWFGNVGPGTAQIRVEVRPALRMEEMLVASAALATRGRFFGTRLPRLTDLAALLLEFQRELAVPNVPPLVVRAIMTPLAWLARGRVGGAP
jgi:quercetin dioxygenase-like cupin family protein